MLSLDEPCKSSIRTRTYRAGGIYASVASNDALTECAHEQTWRCSAIEPASCGDLKLVKIRPMCDAYTSDNE